MSDSALGTGVEIGAGKQRFRFQGSGEHLVEIFLWSPEVDRHPFVLSVDGKAVDSRPVIAPGPGRMRPKTGMRWTSLLAVVNGPASIVVVTASPRWVLSAARWTAMDRFERELVPVYLAASRESFSRVLSAKEHGNPLARRAWLQHLSDRLVFSRDATVRREAVLNQTRAWFWKAAEDHEPDEILQTKLLFEAALKVMPEEPILRQMISASCTDQVSPSGRMPRGPFCESVAPVRWSPVPPPPVGAPEWAATQQLLTRRLDAITRWWVERRQMPNGELGGGWGDDVEILRQWGPQALGVGSEAAARGVLSVAGGLWTGGMLRDGYDRSVSDVEHSSEPTTDTVPLALALSPASDEIASRAALTAACSENWIVRQADGRLRFRSSWFNCRDADTSPARAVDVHMNVRAMGPALWHAYISRDPALIERIAGWADSWIHAMRSTEHGKPRGLFPPAMRSADGNYKLGASWDKPEVEWDYFQWSGGSQEALTNLVLAVYDLTGDRKYLDAATESFGILKDCAGDARRYCEAMRNSPEAYYQWRQVTNDARLDGAYGYRAETSEQDVLSAMTRQAKEMERRYSINFDIMTSEVFYTDRVYYPMSPEYRQRLFGGESPRGDRYPAFAVTWPSTKVEFARAVVSAAPDSIRLRVFLFDAAASAVPVRLWRMKPGRYRWTDGTRTERFEIKALPHTVEIPLYPRRDTAIAIEVDGAQ